MTNRDEMIERAKAAVLDAPRDTTIFEDFADFAASEIARERERIADDLDRILDDPSFEIVDHPGYEMLRKYIGGMRQV